MVAAAVALPVVGDPEKYWPIAEVCDSKEVSLGKRRVLVPKILDLVSRLGGDCAIAEVSVQEIDSLGPGEAHSQALKRAVFLVSKGGTDVDLLIVDGNKRVTEYRGDQYPLPKADSKFFAVAAASILAKHHRDMLMSRLHQEFPRYGWSTNKGYPTRSHRTALAAFGPSMHHRAKATRTALKRLELE